MGIYVSACNVPPVATTPLPSSSGMKIKRRILKSIYN